MKIEFCEEFKPIRVTLVFETKDEVERWIRMLGLTNNTDLPGSHDLFRNLK